MSAARTELAEVYVWGIAIWNVHFLLLADDFRDRRSSLLAGLLGAAGAGSKLSYPVLVAPLGLWFAARGLLRRDSRRSVLTNLALAMLLSATVAFVLLAHNWRDMLGHLRSQYSWVGQLYSGGPKWELATLSSYSKQWLQWYGGVSLCVLAAGLALAVLTRAGRRGAAVVLPLVLGALFNLVYCYFHPVTDMRFTFGSFLLAFFAGSIGLGRACAGSRLLTRGAAAALLLGSSYVLLDHAYLGSIDHSVLGTPSAGEVPRAPLQAPDLRDWVIDHYPDASDPRPYFVFVGDHIHLNLNNLELSLIARGRDGILSQPGYLPPELTPLQRLQANGRGRLWVVTDSDDFSEQSPFGPLFVPMLALMRRHPEVFRELEATAALTPHTTVRLFVTVGDVGSLREDGR